MVFLEEPFLDLEELAAEQVMLENKINSLVVVNEDGKLSGILQIYDIE